jgi:hypothetical protein
MNKKCLLPFLCGLVAGQVFAAVERPLSIVNTLKFGYTDNLYRAGQNEEESFYVTDVVDLAFRAAFSDRTDLTAKTRLELRDDTGGVNFYPNLYLLLNHSISPRFQLSLTEYLRTGDQSGQIGANRNQRDNYYYNKVGIGLDYIADQKNTIESSADYAIKRYEESPADNLDTTTVSAGVGWSHEILPQRTRSTVSVRNSWVDYDNINAKYEQTDGTVLLSHTFNPEWAGSVMAGASHIRKDFPNDDGSTINPLASVGLVYTPSPITRFNADLSRRYTQSDSLGYGGQETTDLRLGVQHDITAKIMGKATARYAWSEYDGNDALTAGRGDMKEERMDLGLKFSYKINRINSLELSLRHRRTERDAGGTDWDENSAYLGWRVEIK